jgi:surface antigen
MKIVPRLMGGALAVLAACAVTGSVRALPLLNPANGHYYDLISPDVQNRTVTYQAAKAEAAGLTFNGATGHLATVASAEEQQFLIDNANNFDIKPAFGLLDYWLGGEQLDKSNEPAGGWSWVTGEPWSYTNWHSGEPNNFGDNEDYLEMWLDNQWSDRASDNGVFGYIVEYEPTNGAIPEPGSMSLLLTAGLPALGLALRRRRSL